MYTCINEYFKNTTYSQCQTENAELETKALSPEQKNNHHLFSPAITPNLCNQESLYTQKKIDLLLIS